jgi:hypothetical protein
VTFTSSESDCVHTPSFDFYDGSSIAANSSGFVIAGFNNVTTGSFDVYRAPSITATFTQVANPFPGKASLLHPRLLTSLSNQSFIYIVAAAGNRGELWINRYDTVADAWGSTPTWPMLVTTDFLPDTIGIPGGIRAGGGFDFMEGRYFTRSKPSWVRVVYTSNMNGHTILKTARCAVDPTGICGIESGGTIDPGTSAFWPAVASAIDPTNGPDPVWKVTWLQQDTPSGNQLAVFSTNINYFGNHFGGRQETQFETPCTDQRGYWGDYDFHLGVQQVLTTDSPWFIRSFTDSTDSSGTSQCFTKWQYRSDPVQVSQIAIPYQ